VIDVDGLHARWRGGALDALAEILPERVRTGLSPERYGDLPRWQDALTRLPALHADTIDLRSPAVSVSSTAPPAAGEVAALERALRDLHPWRKGPYELFGLPVDTEWRSDWKWARLAPHIESLAGRRVLDVGCGNGYHCWRMRGAGAREVIGIDPTPLFLVQFAALQQYIRDDRVTLLPMGIEHLPPALGAFDSVFSMGVLYHRRSPMAHLGTLREVLRPGGQLVLETLVIEGGESDCLVPEGRYARMGNVWFLPSSAMLLLWLRKLGWHNPRVIDESITSTREQRRTDWMTFHSLAEFLDPEDPSRTREGYPAPRRALVLAERT
jgi:tRNA (mo5U34)-methyltransferase